MAVAAITSPLPPANSLERSLALAPRGSAQPYHEDPRRSTQLITAVPRSRSQAGAIPNTAVGFFAVVHWLPLIQQALFCPPACTEAHVARG